MKTASADSCTNSAESGGRSPSSLEVTSAIGPTPVRESMALRRFPVLIFPVLRFSLYVLCVSLSPSPTLSPLSPSPSLPPSVWLSLLRVDSGSPATY